MTSINVDASTAVLLRSLSNANAAVADTMTRISSGERIVRTSDDIAGTVRGQRLASDIAGTNQAITNTQGGLDFINVVAGSLDQISEILGQMRNLALTASNTAETDGSAEQTEFAALRTQIDSIGTTTFFNGRAVFQDYSVTPLTFQIGLDATANSQFDIDRDLVVSSSDIFGGDLSAVDLSTDPTGALATIDTAIASLNAERAAVAGIELQLSFTVDRLELISTTLTAARSRIIDTDIAEETARLTAQQITAEAATAMIAQANLQRQTVLGLLR